jgi:hypothetical protein
MASLKLLRSVLEGKVALAVPLVQIQEYCLQALLRINSPQAQGTLELLGRKNIELKTQIARLKSQQGRL